jgi:hypothetical protein
MNFSDICERTFVEGFLIEAFSSVEEVSQCSYPYWKLKYSLKYEKGQKYYQLLQQQEQRQENVDTCLNTQDIYVRKSADEPRNTPKRSLHEIERMGLVVKNLELDRVGQS